MTAGNVKVDDGYNLVRKSVQDFAGSGALRYTVSTYDALDQMLRDCDSGRGRRVVTFTNILRDKALPLAEAINFMLSQGQSAMQRPVEIEFAGIINPAADEAGIKGHLYWLQIRPIIDKKEQVSDELLDLPDEQLILRSDTALGHGMIDNVDTIVYIRPEKFNSMNNSRLPEILDRINTRFAQENRGYILIGPGRWGSSDSALGIPVKWPQISAARLIVEASLPGYRIEPSQGTHFFQNLTSFGVGYFTIDRHAGSDAFYDSAYLDSLKAEYEDDFIRIVRFGRPLTIAINGRRGIGMVAKPDITETQN